jgi:hypothetical protein
MNLLHATQLALTLGAFLGQNVTSEGLFVFEAIRRLLKALGCSTVRFNFWHFKYSAFVFYESALNRLYLYLKALTAQNSVITFS